MTPERRARSGPEAEVQGRPVFAMRPEDREAVAELLAEALLADLEAAARADASGGAA